MVQGGAWDARSISGGWGSWSVPGGATYTPRGRPRAAPAPPPPRPPRRGPPQPASFLGPPPRNLEAEHQHGEGGEEKPRHGAQVSEPAGHGREPGDAAQAGHQRPARVDDERDVRHPLLFPARPPGRPTARAASEGP